MLVLGSWLTAVLLLAQSLVASSIPRRFYSPRCPADIEERWTYRGLRGPYFWGFRYPACYGIQQSPVAIVKRAAVKDENLAKLSMENYDIPASVVAIENNGHTVQATPEDGVVRSIVVNNSTYNLQQFHFHWGTRANKGSEHTLDGVQYAMELHFVHTNTDGEGAVVGVLFEEGDDPNVDLQPIVDALPKLLYKGTNTTLESSLNLNNLLPENPSSYYRYQGSLTTPTCAEGITWSVLPKVVHVGSDQMKEFRELFSAREEVATEQCTLSNNYRPIQALFGRQVFLSE